MQFKSQWFGEALATPAYPLDSREETIFEALGGTRKSTTPPEMRPEVVRSPRVQYVQ